MRKKINTRKELANPYIDQDYYDRLSENNFIDLQNNCTITQVNDKYIKINSINPSIKHKKP